MSLGTLVDTLRLASKPIRDASRNSPGMAVATLSRSRIRYLDTGTGERTVVIAPDPPNTIEHHLPMVEQLRSRHRVIVFDLPGFGFSYPRLRYGFTAAELEICVRELLELLGVKEATVVMSCLAAHAALRAAESRPDLIGRLVLAQAPSINDSLDWARRMDQRRVLGTPVLGQLMMATQGRKVAEGWYRAALPKGSDTSAYFEPAARALSHGGCYCLASAFQQFRRETHRTRYNLAQPVTVFWGEADRTHRPSDPFGLIEQVPHAEVHVLAGCGHFPDLERTPLLVGEISR